MKAASKTRERIVSISLALFNEHGERSISTNHIADAADISAGNLYYHFANKQQIVGLLVARYQRCVSDALSASADVVCGVERLRGCLHGVITAIWGYRFIYRDLEHLIQADPALAEDHRAFSVACLRDARTLLEGLCNSGMFNMNAQAQQAVAINAWLILTSWVRYLYTTLPAPAITPAAVRRGAWQALCLLQGFTTPEAASAVAALMAEFKDPSRAEPSASAGLAVSGTSA